MPEPWNGPYFMEGTPWHYSTYVPHDPQGLINRHGGPGQFVDFLNQMFDGNYYSQNNEPDILTPYLYNYAQRPDKTAERVRNILEKEYQPTLTGWPGNDDAGCLSSWYIFSAMGFYPNAGQDVYLIGSPIFSKVEIKLGNGRTFSIIANNVSEANKYVQAATLNGAEWNKNWFRHSEISKGGELILQMGSHPSAWGTTGELPPSVSKPD
jgi:predicted alpha-1,2-mannosidase